MSGSDTDQSVPQGNVRAYYQLTRGGTHHDPVSTILFYLVMSFIFFLSVTPADPSGLRGQRRIGQI